MDEGPAAPEKPRNAGALAFLVGGAIAFLCIFTTREGRSIFGFIGRAIQAPINNLGVQSSIVLSTLFTLTAVALASPFLFKWLPSSLLMLIILAPIATSLGIFLAKPRPPSSGLGN